MSLRVIHEGQVVRFHFGLNFHLPHVAAYPGVMTILGPKGDKLAIHLLLLQP